MTSKYSNDYSRFETILDSSDEEEEPKKLHWDAKDYKNFVAQQQIREDFKKHKEQEKLKKEKEDEQRKLNRKNQTPEKKKKVAKKKAEKNSTTAGAEEEEENDPLILPDKKEKRIDISKNADVDDIEFIFKTAILGNLTFKDEGIIVPIDHLDHDEYTVEFENHDGTNRVETFFNFSTVPQFHRVLFNMTNKFKVKHIEDLIYKDSNIFWSMAINYRIHKRPLTPNNYKQGNSKETRFVVESYERMFCEKAQKLLEGLEQIN